VCVCVCVRQDHVQKAQLTGRTYSRKWSKWKPRRVMDRLNNMDCTFEEGIEIINLWDISLFLTDDFLLVKPLVRKLMFLNELDNYSGNSIRLRKILIK